jgi:hypothetical protein
MILTKTRKVIADTVSQPAKNATIFSLAALALSLIAFLLAAIAVNR